MVALDALVVSTALNTIRVHLGASVEQPGWTVNAYTLSFAVLLMPAAVVGDRLGRRRVFTAGLRLFAAACVRGPPSSPSVFSLVTTFACRLTHLCWANEPVRDRLSA